MRRLSTVFVVMLTAFLFATGAVASAGAKVLVGDESAERAKVLIIGDSVFDAFDHVASAPNY